MIDIETLATDRTAVVLSIGMCRFDPKTLTPPSHKTVLYPSLEEQLTLGRTVSDSTLEWWSTQDQEILARALTEDNRQSLEDICSAINKFVVGSERIWAQGPLFDIIILEDMYSNIEHHTNWSYWQISDSRTVFNMTPTDPRKEIQQDLHDAGEDAYYQAVAVQKAYSMFGIGK